MKKVARSGDGWEPANMSKRNQSDVPAGPWSIGLALVPQLLQLVTRLRNCFRPSSSACRPVSSPSPERTGSLDRFDRSLARPDTRSCLHEEIAATRWASSSSRGWSYVRWALNGGSRREGSSGSADTSAASTERSPRCAQHKPRLRSLSLSRRGPGPLFFRARSLARSLVLASLCTAAATASRRLLKPTGLVEPVWWGVVILAARRENRNWFVSHRASSFRPVWLHPAAEPPFFLSSSIFSRPDLALPPSPPPLLHRLHPLLLSVGERPTRPAVILVATTIFPSALIALPTTSATFVPCYFPNSSDKRDKVDLLSRRAKQSSNNGSATYVINCSMENRDCVAKYILWIIVNFDNNNFYRGSLWHLLMST